MPLVAGALKQVGWGAHAVIIHGLGLDETNPLRPATILEVSPFYSSTRRIVEWEFCVVAIVIVSIVPLTLCFL